MQETDTLIRTKLHPPFIRPELVMRPRLQEMMVRGLRVPLTLIIAPAGSGKTTLVASCIDKCGLTTAWLALDKDDNQPARFLTYLVAALQVVDPTIGGEASRFLAARPPAQPKMVLTSLINDLEKAREDMALVLDDYQIINTQAIHEPVAFLLEHCPKTFHLVISSRSDPPLPLARLLARCQAIELRNADISFTEDEAAQFLNDVMGLNLDRISVAFLKDRTEGWIAGLQMAALSMRERKDVTRFIERFSGTNRYIMDYLLEEVLANQTPEIQRFLLNTSILERLNAQLCDAVIQDRESKMEDRTESPITTQDSQSILEYLERSNLFLVPLDDERNWYRYHQLFSDLLQTQLHKSIGVQGVTRLHLRAASWYELNGSVLDAIQHASLASDDEKVERLIEQNYMEMMNRGEMSWIRSWTGKLSKDLVYQRPWLCIYEASSHAWFGELDLADFYLSEAKKHIPQEITSIAAQSMLGHLAYVKSRVTAMRGDLKRAIELCQSAREYFQPDNLAMQLDTSITLGYEYFLKGDYDSAVPVLEQTIQTGRSAGSIINTVAAACLLARLHAIQGQLKQAEFIYQSVRMLIPETKGQHLGARALIDAGLAEVLCEHNDLQAALEHVRHALAFMSWWGKADDEILANLTLSRICLAQANQSEAIRVTSKAIHLMKTRGVFSEARTAAETAQVRLWLHQGNHQAAGQWADSQDANSSIKDLPDIENEMIQITRARVLISQNRNKEALIRLQPLENSARAAGRMGRVIEILILEALALQQAGEPAQAIQALTEGLSLAAVEGYQRLFLDEGRPMQVLLAHWLSDAKSSTLQDYGRYLLSQFQAEIHKQDAGQMDFTSLGQFNPGARVDLFEPLSQRELEVIELIATGMTNPEIAKQLIVSPGTIKAHTANIYRKLEVGNRTEAVTRARQLGILK